MPFWVFSIYSHSLFNMTLTMSFGKLKNVIIIRLWFEEKIGMAFCTHTFFCNVCKKYTTEKEYDRARWKPREKFPYILKQLSHKCCWNKWTKQRWCQIRTTSRGLHRLTDLLTTYLNTNNRNKFTTHLPSLIKIQYV